MFILHYRRLGPTRETEMALLWRARAKHQAFDWAKTFQYLIKNVFILSYGGNSFPAKVFQESQSGSVLGRVRWNSAVQQWKLVFVRQIRSHGRVRNLMETKNIRDLRYEIVIMSVQKKLSDSIGRSKAFNSQSVPQDISLGVEREMDANLQKVLFFLSSNRVLLFVTTCREARKFRIYILRYTQWKATL